MDAGFKVLIFGIPVAIGIVLFLFGFSIYMNHPLGGCEVYITDEDGETVPNNYQYSLWYDSYDKCVEDHRLSSITMALGGLICPIAFIAGLVSFVAAYNQKNKYDPNANQLTSGNKEYYDGEWVEKERKKE